MQTLSDQLQGFGNTDDHKQGGDTAQMYSEGHTGIKYETEGIQPAAGPCSRQKCSPSRPTSGALTSEPSSDSKPFHSTEGETGGEHTSPGTDSNWSVIAWDRSPRGPPRIVRSCKAEDDGDLAQVDIEPSPDWSTSGSNATLEPDPNPAPESAAEKGGPPAMHAPGASKGASPLKLA